MKQIKILWNIFFDLFSIYKNLNCILSEKQRKASWKVKHLFKRRKRQKAKNGREWYKNFSEEEKDKGRLYEREGYKNLSEDEKQKASWIQKQLYNGNK